MLASVRLALALALGPLVLVAGCSSRRPSVLRAPSVVSGTSHDGEHASGSSLPVHDLEEHDVEQQAPDSVPKVVRRILIEQKDLVARSQAMALELPDPRGRARALAELDELAQDLARIAEVMARATRGTGAIDSDGLDAVVSDLLLLDTRISLLHEKLRTATERTTAVLVE
jgi:hypothetical protein